MAATMPSRSSTIRAGAKLSIVPEIDASTTKRQNREVSDEERRSATADHAVHGEDDRR